MRHSVWFLTTDFQGRPVRDRVVYSREEMEFQGWGRPLACRHRPNPYRPEGIDLRFPSLAPAPRLRRPDRANPY